MLKAPLWPDPTADRGQQRFTYAIYPHAGGWQTAKTVQKARNLNIPVRPWIQDQDIPINPLTEGQRISDTGSFLSLGETTWVLSALKLAEDSDHQFILRGYESAGSPGNMGLNGGLSGSIVAMTTLLEHPVEEDAKFSCGDPVALRPWQVVSLRLDRGRRSGAG